MTDNQIPLGGRLPSETELMSAFSLSRSSVRQVLAELTVAGWVERRQGRGTFHIAKAGRETPQNQRSMLVGVWFNWPQGPLYGPIVEGIREELAEWRYHAVFEDGGFDVGAEAKGVEALVHKAFDGFIVAPSSNPRDDHRPLERLIERKVPLVLVDRMLPDRPADLVTTANELGAEQLVGHLIELGHQKIAFIGGGGLSTVEDRLRGYRLTLKRNGLCLDDAWVHAEEMPTEDCGRRALAELLTLPKERRPTAVFCANDIIGETVAAGGRAAGLRIPEDLSVTGFDDVMPSSDHTPWLTTYAQPKRRIGREAARLLMQRITTRPANCVTLLLEGHLVKRASTGPAPAN